ncbi:M56 family metallopeptidase [Mucilaginibacter ginsenosidivorax]|uniref:Peptidase M56 domain-containing protein n=1 Tax=Mucilaginibacter ginsenosidivorax TaxID=862126 RepID=A0A5B8VUI0_9SPHI|nr:M56 family metallopeptidase [Mucilaginibacter ginsenosidivorax]QEC75314.1 hypothetical protein FSB76_04925 [Mucilaginibacter ginsenosidivorax]
MEAIAYLLQVSACTGVFYMFYYAFLRRLTFFTINRWYLLATLLLSFVIPAIKIRVDEQPHYVAVVQHVVYVNAPEAIQPIPFNAAPPKMGPVAPPVNRASIMGWVYVVAVISLSGYLFITLIIFFTRIKGKPLAKMGNVKIVSGYKKLGNGSFFNYIFLADENICYEDLKHVIGHEMMHVRLYHSADRVIARLAQIALWFNPFAYLFASAIEANHEFEVDAKMTHSVDKRVYANLLLQLSVTGQGMLHNGFSKVQLTGRIQMLFNKPSKNMKKLTYVLIVPMVTISCLVFATSLKTSAKKNAPAVTVTDTAVKYRQKVKYGIGQQLSMAKFKAYQQTDDYKNKSALVREIINKEIAIKVTELIRDKKTGIPQGYKVTYNSMPLEIKTFYGDGKELYSLLNVGDEVTVKLFGGGIGEGIPVVFFPQYIVKNNVRIFQPVQPETIREYPFLYEVNRVRFTDGKVAQIEKDSNGKWKTAVIEKDNGYRFNLAFKANSPDFAGIKQGDQVRLRFVHEVKTGKKVYAVNDWVSISENIADYGFKNPDMFYKFYEKM